MPMQSTPATKTVLDGILSFTPFLSDYCSVDRDWAIEAVEAGRAAFLTKGGYHNQLAANATAFVNRGDGTLSDFIAEQVASRTRKLEQFVGALTDVVMPLNDAARLQLEAARWLIAGGDIQITHAA